MNIAFFLLPKDEVVYLTPQSTIRQALERMERHRYTAVPIIDREGRYVGTLTEGDLLWKIKNTPGLSFENAHKYTLEEVPRRMENKPVRIDAEMLDLISLAKVQNFVPVEDDMGIFIGIVRRSEIIEYCAQLLANCHEQVQEGKNTAEHSCELL
ncbi:CBS domain-containing protein [Zhaonella formicivorans]|jgi:CBS domain-containing protein|uniref:CBS domain-containing protein n=1 Tax=Zhaonella formicivorans TaxID=2528593 RepID=UPI0010E79FD9|nr:CBS domain-containing protein [Zhaonella formicivorans]